MYNLEHLNIYDKTIQQDLDISIDLLIRTSDFFGSFRLLIIALIKKYGFAQETIKNIIIKHANGSENLASKIVEVINNMELLGPESLEFINDLLSYVDFAYNANQDPVQTTDLNIVKKPKVNNSFKIK
ncbi:hypothetical protein M9Y10_031485 [Tritrichomonas musculus]|uniref:Uncharacterized protein n=1 Tax=Tritrichomonas musculus TaxID=1915356 RepID=A0ABR2H1P1_9EUKA